MRRSTHMVPGWQARWAGACAVAACGLMLSASPAQAAERSQASQPLPEIRADGSYAARVTRVFDGDTVWVQPLDGSKYRKLRLDGIDAPEICQPGGPAAREALSARVLQQTVWVRERAQDDYGRGLARLRLGQEDMGAYLVGQGLVWSYRWRRSLGPYVNEEARAREKQLGLFALPAGAVAESPRDFRRRNGPCF